ncbi:peptide N-acetyl-beta-D-glucosaminyl asparaginase amidase A-domain-containing protein [Armillaria luteobubalina]|uniref:Peptide N-acetyl-beta-D-glucosaminyl asparaginase amidase A-domain-containing protein n=1 Tax=Armillaria luteobubalina TaxID=153913 RepID=A0AA39UWS8_9AGAR|nr:peptide N-acetyl-beta-D-glucosaminyl asparaginase amidase A-domain-containing protein [Armillaria luteobubalina]
MASLWFIRTRFGAMSLFQVLCTLSVTFAQLTKRELGPLIEGFAGFSTGNSLTKRVPLMTDDPTVAPLVDLQVFAPPVVPREGQSCQVELLAHSFGDGSYNNPAIVAYSPPTDPDCGTIGQWAAISLNVSVSSNGTQYDRLGSIYLSHVEMWRTSSAEPTKTGTTWNIIKDVTHFTPLFAEDGDLMMDFSNIISEDLLLDGVFDVILKAMFYAPTPNFPTPRTSDLIIPFSNLSPTVANYFTLDSDTGATTLVSLPDNTTEAYVEIFCSGNSAEEFWYLNTPDEFTQYFPYSTGVIGKGPFREVQVFVDDKLFGVIWPYAVIYTGGITPSNWRPLTSYGAYDAPSYWIDITPALPIFLDSGKHNVSINVMGQGTNPSINSNWFVSGSVHVRTGSSQTSGAIKIYEVPDLDIQTFGGASEGNETVWTRVAAHRELRIQSEIHTSEGTKIVTFTQSLNYTNDGAYIDEGWIQWGNQTTTGTTESKHGEIRVLRDAFAYPLSVFSNYSLYEIQFGGYGSEINQTHLRAIQLPTGPYKSIHSVQHAKGWIGMDDWPGLRHAINGTGETEQTFAYVDGRGATYFRDIAAKNDGWVHDRVGGTLRDANRPVPDNQIYGPVGGPGFRR